MGALLAKFKKEKTTSEILEKLDSDIKDIEEFSVNTQAKQKRLVGNFLIISIGLYVVGFLVFYFVFFPPTWIERLTYSVPLLLFPLIIFLLRRLLAWYFQRKINKNSSKLDDLRAEKKKVLEKVMEKETYKVALDILNRFGDKSSNFKAISAITPRKQVGTPLSVAPVPKVQGTGALQRNSQAPSIINQSGTQETPLRPVPSNRFEHNLMSQQASTRNNNSIQLQRIRTPYPVINQQDKGILEKMVDYLIGDGPQNRYAMICKECFSHNGMAGHEEYEYTTFRCAFCNVLNPSRKARPIAPKLPMATPTHLPNTFLAPKQIAQNDSSDTSSSSEKNSDSEEGKMNLKTEHIEEEELLSTYKVIKNPDDEDDTNSDLCEKPTVEKPTVEEPTVEKPTVEKKND